MTDDTERKNPTMGIVGIAALATWYILTSNPKPFDTERIKSQQAPGIVQTVDNALSGIDLGKNDSTTTYSSVLPDTIMTIDGPIKTADIDFEGDFDIRTDRYRIVKDEDWWLSRGLGWLGSLPFRLFFWDYDVSNGLDEQRIKQVWATLENDPSIKDITVRLNHTGAIEDLGRLFNDEKVVERNPGLARALMGVPTSLLYEMWAELRRGDYYNPLTQTAVLYSNVEGIDAHELGHFKDFHRFSTDWAYSFVHVIPGGTLYMEARASLYAKDMLESDQNNQLYRYLVPAFATYVIAEKNKLKKAFKKAEEAMEESR
jgi:hypothetical protein